MSKYSSLVALFFFIAMAAFLTQAEEIPMSKARFSHAEFYYPKGKYNSLNQVSIGWLPIPTCHFDSSGY